MENAESTRRKRLGQYFTPRWVAEAIVEQQFSDLAPGSTVVHVHSTAREAESFRAGRDSASRIGGWRAC